jgi:putative transposase
MPRTARQILAGVPYHVINRGNNRSVVFGDASDYRQFLRLIEQAQERVPLSLLAICLMPTHFHLVVLPGEVNDVSRWMQWLLTTHTHRHHLPRGTCGRVWQGRYKAFPIQHDAHLLTVMRYVERNALRAGLVARAEDWPWGSLAWRLRRTVGPQLTQPPSPLPRDWPSLVNEPQTPSEVDALRKCAHHQRPFGTAGWVDETARRIGLPVTPPARGRPRGTGRK